jgi:hypothetical protein
MGEFFTEVRNFILGVAMEGSKGLKVKGTLFIWPFAIFVVVIVVLLVRVFFT